MEPENTLVPTRKQCFLDFRSRELPGNYVKDSTHHFLHAIILNVRNNLLSWLSWSVVMILSSSDNIGITLGITLGLHWE